MIIERQASSNRFGVIYIKVLQIADYTVVTLVLLETPYTIVRSYSKIQSMQSAPAGCPERLHLAAINSHVLF